MAHIDYKTFNIARQDELGNGITFFGHLSLNDPETAEINSLNHNVVSTFNVCRLAVPLMLKNTPGEDGEKGVIINSSGFMATEGNLTQAFMSGTCGAINSMTLPLARDLAEEGIRVVTISPGIFDSPVTGYWPKPVKTFFGSLSLFPHRIGNLEDYADHAVAVINNKMLNGVVVRLDGGYRNNF